MFNRKARNLELALEVQESRGFWQDVGHRFIRNNKTIIGLLLLGDYRADVYLRHALPGL